MKKGIENDKALAAYYKEAFENPEAFFIGVKTPDGDIPEGAICVRDKDL